MAKDGLGPDIYFQQRITERLIELVPAERRVALRIRDHRDDAAFESAQTIGERAGTSDATVVRAAKALGCAILTELKRPAGAALAPPNQRRCCATVSSTSITDRKER